MKPTLALLGILTACTTASDDSAALGGKGDGASVDHACADARYANGTCDLALACEVPDLDCFQFFETEAQAEALLGTLLGERLAYVEAADARYQRAARLMAQAWQGFVQAHPVGELRARTPSLTVAASDVANAFAYGTATQQAFALHINTALLARPDVEVLFTLSHELAHVTGLHQLRKRSVMRYYHVDDAEPLGLTMANEPAVQTPVAAWQTLARIVGDADDEPLSVLPYAGAVVTAWELAGRSNGTRQAACVQALANFEGLARGIDRDVLTEAIVLRGVIAATSFARLSDVERACAGAQAGRATELVAKALGVPEAAVVQLVAAAGSPVANAQAQGMGVYFQLGMLVAHTRALMRGHKQAVVQQGFAWPKVRWYTIEEQADDFATAALVRAGSRVDDFAFALLTGAHGEALAQTCRARLASGEVPAYGTLGDDHHALCYRAYHMREVARHVEAGGSVRP